MKIQVVFILVVLLSIVPLFAQDTLVLNNPSFEDTPRHSKVPEGWINCGFKEESPPDIGPTDFFRAKTQANHGQTHLVMVTRGIGTWERIGNLLSSAMKAGSCYTFSLDLARTPTYLSVSRATKTAINFNRPVRLRIWGANEQGQPQELLAVSEAVEHEDWRRYHFQLCPLAAYPMLVLEAMYVARSEQAYAGNIMLDNCSALIETTTAQRNERQLAEWNAELIPGSKAITNTEATKKSAELADTFLLEQYMEDIRRGRIDIGLTNLATYIKDFSGTPWVIVIGDRTQSANKEKMHTLRKRLKAMRLKPYIKVKFATQLPQAFQYLLDDLGWVK